MRPERKSASMAAARASAFGSSSNDSSFATTPTPSSPMAKMAASRKMPFPASATALRLETSRSASGRAQPRAMSTVARSLSARSGSSKRLRASCSVRGVNEMRRSRSRSACQDSLAWAWDWALWAFFKHPAKAPDGGAPRKSREAHSTHSRWFWGRNMGLSEGAEISAVRKLSTGRNPFLDSPRAGNPPDSLFSPGSEVKDHLQAARLQGAEVESAVVVLAAAGLVVARIARVQAR